MNSKIKFPNTINKETRKLNFLSVSSVEKFDPTIPFGCPRSWGFRYIDGIRDEATDAKTLGDITHEQLEHYERTGEDVLGPVARAGKHLVYEPGPGLVVEHEAMGDISIEGIPFYVRLDLVNYRDYYLDDSGQRRALEDVEVNDWKTTGGDKKTGAVAGKAKLGVELLSKTVQMPVYGLWALTLGGGDAVRLSHTYFGTRRREALKSTKLATRTEIEDRIDQVRRTVASMINSATATSGGELEPNYLVCHATQRGCQYLEICPRSAANLMQDFGAKLGAMLEQRQRDERRSDMSGFDSNAFLAGLNANKSAAPAAAPQPVAPAPVQAAAPVPAPVAPAAAPAYTQADLDAEVARRMAQLGLSPAAPPAPAPVPNVYVTGPAAQAVVPDAPAGAGVITSAASAQAAGLAVPGPGVQFQMPAPLGIQPTDAPASGSQVPAAKPIAPEQLITMPAPIQAAAQAVAPAPVPVAMPAPFQLPGVPTSAQMPVPLAGVPQAAAPVPAPAAQPAPAAPDQSAPKRGRGRPKKVEGAPGTSPASGIMLLVDCVGEGVDPEPLQEYIDGLVDQLCTGLKVSDLRCAPDDSPLAFGKWKGLLSTFVKAQPPAPGVYSIFVEGSEIRACVVEALRGLCSAYIKGVRS